MDRTPEKDYPDQIKQLRARLGLTQVVLAERLGVSFPTVNGWENRNSNLIVGPNVVYNCATPACRLVRVQDPFGTLLAKAKGSVRTAVLRYKRLR